MEEPEIPLEHLHEEVHHRAHQSSWTLGVALSSAMLAVLAAIASLNAGENANEAISQQIEKNDEWAYYQSEGIKRSQILTKIELLRALGKEVAPSDEQKVKRYEDTQAELLVSAKKADTEAARHLSRHERLARSVTLFQIGIALGAISVLVQRRSFWFISLAFGVIGVAFMAHALFF